MDIDQNADSQYFQSYEDLEIHELMLLDTNRTNAYAKAILSGSDNFKDKIVLDVGSGTGILSLFCAKAGAKKVFAVEASNVAKLAEQVIKDNQMDNVITVFQTTIEEFCLPDGYDKVDIIVSEWMGFYLLHESMLESVIYARDKFLAEDGLMYPDSAMIYLAPCSLPQQYDLWDNLYGVNLRSVGNHLRNQRSGKPFVTEIKQEDLLRSGNIVAWYDLMQITIEDIQKVLYKEVLVTEKAGILQGLCLWFECTFPAGNDGEPVILDTSPGKETHWKQSLIMLPDHAVASVDENQPIAVKISMEQHPINKRHYNIELEMLDAEQEEHPLPCNCHLTKCILIKAHLLKTMQANNARSMESM